MKTKQEYVEIANKAEDFVTKKFGNIQLKFKKELTKEEQILFFGIVEKNMKKFFEKSNSWDEKEKKDELKAEWMRFYIAYDEEKLVGFASFRFDLDNDRKVVYLYELQVIKEYQGKGIGSFFIETLEDVCKLYKMDYLMLTVLKVNEKAKLFYQKNRFKIDKYDLSFDKVDVHYEILSKRILKRK